MNLKLMETVNSLDTTLHFHGLTFSPQRYEPRERPPAEDAYKEIQAAMSELNNGRWQTGLDQLKRLVIYFPDQPRLFLYKALAEANLAKFEEAQESLGWLLLKDSNNQEGLALLEKVQELLKQTSPFQIISADQPATQSKGVTDFKQLYEKAIKFLECGENAHAAEILKQLIDNKVREPGINYFYAFALHALGHYQQSATALEAQLILTPNDALTLQLKDQLNAALQSSPLKVEQESFDSNLKPVTHLVTFSNNSSKAELLIR